MLSDSFVLFEWWRFTLIYKAVENVRVRYINIVAAPSLLVFIIRITSNECVFMLAFIGFSLHRLLLVQGYMLCILL